MAVLNKNQKEVTKTVTEVITEIEEYDATENSEDYGPAPGLTISEDEEVNITRFDEHNHEYKSYLDFLASLFPNAFAIHLAAQSGIWTGVDTGAKAELEADKLDLMLDLDHFVKSYRGGEWENASLDSETKEKIFKLYQMALTFFNEDNTGVALPDYGDTKISEDNGSDQYTRSSSAYLEKEAKDKFVISGMDARYSDMRYVTSKAHGSEGEDGDDEENPFNASAADFGAFTTLSQMLADCFDLNNDGIVGVDDVILILNFYADYLNSTDPDKKYSMKVTTSSATTLHDMYNSDFQNFRNTPIHNSDFISAEINNSKEHSGNEVFIYNPELTTLLHFYMYTKDYILTIENTSYTISDYFHPINSKTCKVSNIDNKLLFLEKVFGKNTSSLIVDTNNGSLNFSTTTLTVGDKTQSLKEWLRDMAIKIMPSLKTLTETTVYHSELGTEMLKLIAKYGDRQDGYVSTETLADKFLNALVSGDIVGFFEKVNWKDYYKNSTYTDEKVSEEGWNESINDLYHFMKEYFENHGLNPDMFKTPAAWLQALKEANAKGTPEQWYLDPTPLVNLFNEIYTEERTDEIKMNVHNMDYTNEGENLGTGAGMTSDGQTYNYGELIAYVVNLLMPQYRRRVEVEDLDKNFWVISQLLAILLNQVFGDDGLEAILKGHMAEIMELWNNVKYLWNVIEAQGKMINDLAVALAESQEPEVEPIETEYYRDVFQYNTNSYISAKAWTSKEWVGRMWDINGDGFITDYEPQQILRYYAESLIDLKLEVTGSDNTKFTITPGNAEGFKNVFTLSYDDAHSIRDIEMTWNIGFGDISKEANWKDTNGNNENIFYTIGGPAILSQGTSYDVVNPSSDSDLLEKVFFSSKTNNPITNSSYASLNDFIGDSTLSNQGMYGNYTFSNSRVGNTVGKCLRGLFSLVWVPIDFIKSNREGLNNRLIRIKVTDNSSEKTLQFSIDRRGDHLRPIMKQVSDLDCWNKPDTMSFYTASSSWFDRINRSFVYQGPSAMGVTNYNKKQNFYELDSNNNKIFYNKFLLKENGNVKYILCSIYQAGKAESTHHINESSGLDYTYDAEKTTSDIYFAIPIVADQFLSEGLSGADSNGNYSEIISSSLADTTLAEKVAINMLKKVTILSVLQLTEGLDSQLKSETATALKGIIGNNLPGGISTDTMANKLIISQSEEEKIYLKTVNNSILVAGLISSKSTLDNVEAINQQFEIQERPLRIYSTDGETISRYEIVNNVEYKSGSIIFTRNYNNPTDYTSEKLFEGKVISDGTTVDINDWKGFSSSINGWYPTYYVGQPFNPDSRSYANFVCETSLSEKIHEFNNYEDQASTADSDDSYYLYIEGDSTTYGGKEQANFTVTFDDSGVKSTAIKCKG